MPVGTVRAIGVGRRRESADGHPPRPLTPAISRVGHRRILPSPPDALLPDYCNRGIGTTVLRTLQAEARPPASRFASIVERINPALRLYERLGFRLVEDRGVHLFLEWKPAAP